MANQLGIAILNWEMKFRSLCVCVWDCDLGERRCLRLFSSQFNFESILYDWDQWVQCLQSGLSVFSGSNVSSGSSRPSEVSGIGGISEFNGLVNSAGSL